MCNFHLCSLARSIPRPPPCFLLVTSFDDQALLIRQRDTFLHKFAHATSTKIAFGLKGSVLLALLARLLLYV